MRRQLIAALVAVTPYLAACENRSADAMSEKRVRYPFAEVVQSAKFVTAHRIDTKVDSRGFVNYIVRSEGVQVESPERARLASVLDSIDYKPSKLRCAFEPGVEYRFSGGAQAIGLKVCFSCGEVKFVGDGEASSSPAVTLDGAAKGEFLRITKALFPKDREFQELR